MNEITVTKMEAVGKGKIRVSFDTGLSCLLYRGEIRSLGIREADGIDGDTYDRMLHEVLGKRAKKRAMHLLERMDRTKKQLYDKLLEGEYPADCIEEAIAYVESYHYIDDARYACNYVRYAQEKKSRMRIRQELLKKGVSSELIDAALEEEFCSDEEEQIKELLIKKKYDPEHSDEKEFRRTYSFLLRRGFRSGDILKAMKQ